MRVKLTARLVPEAGGVLVLEPPRIKETMAVGDLVSLVVDLGVPEEWIVAVDVKLLNTTQAQSKKISDRNGGAE